MILQCKHGEIPVSCLRVFHMQLIVICYAHKYISQLSRVQIAW